MKIITMITMISMMTMMTVMCESDSNDDNDAIIIDDDDGCVDCGTELFSMVVLMNVVWTTKVL